MNEPETVSIAEAKSSLPRLVREAEGGAHVTLTRRGRPVAVLIGVEQLARLEARRPSFSEAFATLVERFDPAALGIEPDDVFTRSREADGGRQPPW